MAKAHTIGFQNAETQAIYSQLERQYKNKLVQSIATFLTRDLSLIGKKCWQVRNLPKPGQFPCLINVCIHPCTHTHTPRSTHTHTYVHKKAWGGWTHNTIMITHYWFQHVLSHTVHSGLRILPLCDIHSNHIPTHNIWTQLPHHSILSFTISCSLVTMCEKHRTLLLFLGWLNFPATRKVYVWEGCA